MLQLTENAAMAVEHMLADRPEAGLRIAREDSDGSAARLGLAVAEKPSPGDQIVAERGWRLFVDQAAAKVLDGVLLDAKVNEDSTLEFSIVRPG